MTTPSSRKAQRKRKQKFCSECHGLLGWHWDFCSKHKPAKPQPKSCACGEPDCDGDGGVKAVHCGICNDLGYRWGDKAKVCVCQSKPKPEEVGMKSGKYCCIPDMIISTVTKKRVAMQMLSEIWDTRRILK